MFDTPRGVRRYNIGAHLFGSQGLGGSGFGAGVTSWSQVAGIGPSGSAGQMPGKPVAIRPPSMTLPTTPITKNPSFPIIKKPFDPQPLDTRPWRPINLPKIQPPQTKDATDDEEKKKTDFQTLADAFSHALSLQPVSTQDATPTVIMDPNAGSGNGMNIKTILIVAGLALVAWFAWKKWGKKAVDSAAA